MNERPVFYVNASLLKESSCLLRTYYTLVGQYQSKCSANDIEYGSAFHKFIALMRETGGNYGIALKAATDYFETTPMYVKSKKRYMTVNHLRKTCIDYWEHYGDGKDEFETIINPVTQKPCVEFKFSWPYYTCDQFDVMLAGTIDDICKRKNGCYAIRDYKTTSVWNADEYFKGYRLSAQLVFYRMMLKQYAIQFPDSIYAEVDRSKVGCFIDGIFLGGESKDVMFKRSEVFFYGETQMQDFMQMLADKMQVIIGMLHESIDNPSWRPYREGMLNGSCETKYGACKYFDACSAPDDVARGHVLKHGFKQEPYRPLLFGL